ncbi:MAG TPA: hypothetical protein VFX30_05890 [bacterium]|nr:hypothetical protein [bacterium]
MKWKDQVRYLASQSRPTDASEKALEKWHSHDDSLTFLKNSANDDTAIYISAPSFFIYSLIVPLDRVTGDYVEDILQWNFSASQGYGYGYRLDPVEPYLCQPMEHTGSKILDDSSPIVFLRETPFEKELSTYVEINQQISHLLGIHWLSEMKAWCKLNDLGETIPIAYNIREGDVLCCTLQRSELDFYLFLSKSCLVRVFDISRSEDWTVFDYSEAKKQRIADQENEIFATHGICYGKNDGKPRVSLLRGFQILRCGVPSQTMLLKLQGKEPKSYETFVICDWKNKRVIEWTSDPNQHGNYFVESDLPHALSPAFFKPDVLLRYKQDPKRYTIGERRIECKWAWSLQYDINDEGQVHVYIGDLAHLPYQEQLYWKSFNEKPREGISKRAFKTDFQGSWDLDYDPLRSLKEILSRFPDKDDGNNPLPVWKIPTLPETRDLRYLSYVVTESRKEWEDQVSTLAQILVEGLNEGLIKKLADKYGCRDKEKKLKSGKLLAKILETMGVPAVDIETITKPLAELWALRSSLVSHAGKIDLPTTDLKQHFRRLIQECDRAMRKLAGIVKNGTLNA